MAHLFRNNLNKKLYTIEYLIVDWHFADRGASVGIYAKPYKWKGNVIKHTRGKEIDNFNPKQFVCNNFEIIAQL